MDTSLSPGKNFYQYVNNDWLNDPSNQIPDDYSSWGGFTKLYDDGLNNQIKIVKKLQHICRNYEEEKIFSIWKASINRFKSWEIQESNCNPIFEELNILDNNFQDFFDFINEKVIDDNSYIKCLSRNLYYCQVNGISNVIDFDKGSDLKNVNNVVLDFSVSGISLPSREYYISQDFEDKLSMFKDHLENTRVIMKKNNINLNNNFVENVINFEKKIAEYSMTPDQSREYEKFYKNTTLEGIYNDINNLNSLPRKQEENYEDNNRYFQLTEKEIEQSKEFFESLYIHFDLRNQLEKNYHKNFLNNDTPPDKYHITAFDGDAIRRCLHLILDSSFFKMYHSYMQYQIIKSFHGFCTKELDDEFFDFYSRKLDGQEKQKSPEKRSIGIVNSLAGEMMGKLFVKEYFSEQSKKNMNILVNNILDSMEYSLKNNDWLTENTKLYAIKKLSTFRSKIGYPDIWKDYSDLDIKLGDSLYEISKKIKKWSLKVNFFDKINSLLDREEWQMTPQTVNAYFMPTQNEIVFPAAILQPPFFHQSRETIDFDISEELSILPEIDVIIPCNYGSIGAVIAHEITHGYDDQGRKFDGKGNLNDWWNEEDVNLFKKKTNIMKESVKKYLFIDEDKEYKMNAELTMGENLADIGGLSLSKKALLNYLKERQASELEIKVSLRIFFKSWANVWKQNIKKDLRIMLLNLDPHAPTDFRGNLVQHMDEFYEVFEISNKDKMYLESKNRMSMW